MQRSQFIVLLFAIGFSVLPCCALPFKGYEQYRLGGERLNVRDDALDPLHESVYGTRKRVRITPASN